MSKMSAAREIQIDGRSIHIKKYGAQKVSRCFGLDKLLKLFLEYIL